MSTSAGCLWGTTAENLYLPTEVDFLIAVQHIGQNDRQYIGSFDEYSSVWHSLVSLNLEDGTESSLMSFVRSATYSPALTSQAMNAIGLLINEDTGNGNRISAPNNEIDANVGCQVARVAAKQRFGTVIARRLTGCAELWIQYQVDFQTGNTVDEWIIWITERYDIYELVKQAATDR